ncbi:MAG: hypothetical protein QOK28_2037 [Actinomycetota bacterium]
MLRTPVLPRLLVVCCILFGLDVVALAAHGGGATKPPTGNASASTNTTLTAPTTTAPPPPAVLFGRTTANQPPQVFTATVDGSGVLPSSAPAAPSDQIHGARKVFSKIISSEGAPYSGCGIAGCSSGYTSSTQAGIAVAYLDGSNEKLLTQGGYDAQPVFTPDGASIVYLRHQKGPPAQPYDAVDAVAMMSTDGARVTSFEPPVGWTYSSFAVSPGGNEIAALRVSTNEPAEGAGNAEVVILGLAGRTETKIATGNFHALSWSHHGGQLAALRTRYQDYPKPWQPGQSWIGDDVWILNVDGSAPRQLTNAIARGGLPDNAFCWGYPMLDHATPRWSPDDTRLAFESTDKMIDTGRRNFDVAVADVATGAVTVAFRTPRELCPANSNYGPVPGVEVYGWTR